MNDLDYIFAVARIRVKEKTLLRDSDIAQMITMPDADAVIEFLLTHGWGDTASSRDADAILAAEEAKTLSLINELQLDPEILEILSYPQLFHNLKAGIKETVTSEPHPSAFYPLESYGRETITVAVSNIKIAVRAQKMKKSREFIENALAPCTYLDTKELAKAASGTFEELLGYLQRTDYSQGAEALKESPSAFERWCDNRLIGSLRGERTHSESFGPVLAYYLARQNEIKTVRIILTAKANGFSEDAIRERVREMYV